MAENVIKKSDVPINDNPGSAIISQKECSSPHIPGKNKTFCASIICAVKGIVYALKTEKNFKYYAFICGFFFLINLWISVSLMQHAVYFIVSSVVFALEFMNTAIEHVVDSIYKEFHEEAGRIKDMAAGAVAAAGAGYFLMEGIFIVMRLLS